MLVYLNYDKPARKLRVLWCVTREDCSLRVWGDVDCWPGANLWIGENGPLLEDALAHDAPRTVGRETFDALVDLVETWGIMRQWADVSQRLREY